MTAYQRQAGFSLIKTVVLVAIVGILVVIALPRYNTYMIRSRVKDMLAVAEPAQNALLQERANNASLAGQFPTYAPVDFPTDLSAYPMVSSIKVSSQTPGAIIIEGNPSSLGIADADKFSLVITPNVDSLGNVQWTCSMGKSNPANYANYAPEQCRNPNNIDG